MGSGNMALMEGLVLCLVGVAIGQFSEALLETSTPVPILRYIDSQNADGSYTYGFEGADGTYKIETRLADGQVRGKYGYYDPEGVLREASYGATKEGGFEPQIDGVILPPRQPAPLDPRQNEVEPVVQQQPTAPRRFSNFSPRKAAGEARKQVGQDIKIVNGRRAVLKRRLVKRPPTARPEEVARRDNLRAREEQLEQLREQRRQLAQLQRTAAAPSSQRRRSQAPSQRRESFRSLPAFSNSAHQSPAPAEPYVSYGAEAGSYTISY